MTYPRFQLARAHKMARRVSGSMTGSSTSWANLDTGLDLTLAAAVGDVIEVGASGFWNNEGVFGMLDVVTVVAGAAVNSFGTQSTPDNANDGILAWKGKDSLYVAVAGGQVYPLVAGDISGGQVTLRLRIKCSSASTKTLFATAASPFVWWAKNIGPVDPH